MGDRCNNVGPIRAVGQLIFGRRSDRDCGSHHSHNQSSSWHAYGKLSSEQHRCAERRDIRSRIAGCAAPAQITSPSSQSPTASMHQTDWVDLAGGVKARLNNGKIEAEIPANAAQTQGQITYNFNRSDGTKSAVSTVNLKDIQQHIRYHTDLKIDEAEINGRDYLKVTALHSGVKDIQIRVTGSDGGITNYRLSQEDILNALKPMKEADKPDSKGSGAGTPAIQNSATSSATSEGSKSAVPGSSVPAATPPTVPPAQPAASSTPSSPQPSATATEPASTSTSSAVPSPSAARANQAVVQEVVDQQNQTRTHPLSTTLTAIPTNVSAPDVTKDPKSGLNNPAVVRSEGDQYGRQTSYSILRTLSGSDHTPALLQVVNLADGSQRLNSFVFRAYEACFGTDGKSFFNTPTSLRHPFNISGTTYSQAEVRSDGSVALYPEMHAEGGTFKYLVFDQKVDKEAADKSPWRMIDAQKNSDGSISPATVVIPKPRAEKAKELFDALEVKWNEPNSDMEYGYYEIPNFRRAAEIVAQARDKGELEQLSAAFKTNSSNTSLEDYYYQQTAKAGITPQAAVAAFEDPRIAHGVAAIFREVDGFTNETTLQNLIQGFDKDELGEIERVWNAAYKRSYGKDFQEMLKYELGEAAATAKADESQERGTEFDVQDSLNRITGALAIDSQNHTAYTSAPAMGPQVTYTTKKLHDEAAIASIMDGARSAGKLEELAAAYAATNSGKSLREDIYKQASATQNDKKAIRWVEGPRVAAGVAAIYDEVRGFGTNSQTLTDILNSYRSDLAKIREAWNRAYEQEYGQDFDKMLAAELESDVAQRFSALASGSNSALLTYHLQSDTTLQSPATSQMIELNEDAFNLSKKTGNGLLEPVIAQRGSGQGNVYSILRTTSNGEAPVVLQVASYDNDPTSKLVFKAYSASLRANTSPTGDRSKFFNTPTAVEPPIEISSVKYNKVEIRSDGNIVLYPDDYDTKKDGLKYLRATRGPKKPSVSWALIDVKRNPDGSVVPKQP